MKAPFVVPAIWLAAAISLNSCASEEKKESLEDPVLETKEASVRRTKDDKVPKSGIDLSGGFKGVTYSLGKDELLPNRVDVRAGESIEKQLESATKRKNPDRKAFIALVSMKRLNQKSLAELKRTAKDMMTAEMEKKSTAKVPSLLELELAMAAVREKKYAYAEHFISGLISDSKVNKSIRAAAWNLDGVIAVSDGRLPDAINSWEEALKVDASYDAAQLNLGFYAVKFGDARTAIKWLSRQQDDWYASSGLAVAERLVGNGKKASALCDRVLKARPTDKVSLVNCAINEWQTNKDFSKASGLLDRAKRRSGGGAELERLIASLSREIKIAQNRVKKSEKKPDPSVDNKKQETQNPPKK